MRFIIFLLVLITSLKSFAGVSLNPEQLHFADVQSQIYFLTHNSEIQIQNIGSFPQGKKEEWLQQANTISKTIVAVWGDTILEGDYAQTSEAKVVTMDAYVYRGEIVGFKLTVTAPAVMFAGGHCEFSDKKNDWEGEDCVFGSIQESVLLDSNFNHLRSTDFYPEFNDYTKRTGKPKSHEYKL